MCADVVVRTDSSSGLAVGSRRGLGRLRHVQTRYLWVQQRVQQGDLRLKKEPGDTNVSDALTKTSGRETYDEPIDNDGLRSEKGAQHWRQKRSDELEVEELYVTGENCKLFFNDNRCYVQQYGVFSSKIF